MIPKILGINPNICRLDQANANFQKIIEQFTEGSVGRPVQFRLTEELNLGGNAAAVLLTQDGNTYSTGDVIQVFDWFSLTSGAPFAARGWWWGETGAEGWALRRPAPATTGRAEYDIIWMEVDHTVRFRLTANLSTGSSAAAVILKFDGTDYSSTGKAITVFDYYSLSPTGSGGRGKFQAPSGAEGWARLRDIPSVANAEQYDIVDIEEYARDIEFTLTSTFTAGVASATVDASWCGLSPGATVNVHDDNNNFASAAVGDKGTAGRSEYADPTTPGTPYYKVVFLPGSSGGEQPIRFRLTANLSTGGTAAAVLRTWNGAAFVDGAAITIRDWWSISGAGRGMMQAVTNMEGWARRVEGLATTYDLMWMEQYAFSIEYTMASDWDTDTHTATATVTASWEQGVEPGATVTIHDDTETFTDATTGCKGYAVRSEYADPNTPATPYYKTVRSQRAAERASAVLAGSMCGDEPIIDEETWAIEPHGEETFDPGPPSTLTNEYKHYGKGGDIVHMSRLDKVPPFTWGVDNVEKHEYAQVTNVYVDSNCLKKDYLEKTAVETCSEEDTEPLICWELCPDEEES